MLAKKVKMITRLMKIFWLSILRNIIIYNLNLIIINSYITSIRIRIQNTKI
jgi:hypothetical protein